MDNIVVEIDPVEVGGYLWIKIDDLKNKINNNPQEYTEWLKIAVHEYDFNSVI